MAVSSPIPAGFFLIDKPKGASSHTVVNRVRWVTGVKRVGHAGTLDPLATGLLIILVGKQYTRRQTEFLHLDKTYQVTAELGVATTTYDSTGTVTKTVPWRMVSGITLTKMHATLTKFKGDIFQTVPAYSAVKVAGKKLYERAVAGTVDKVVLPTKQVQIRQLNITNLTVNQTTKQVLVSLTVQCSSGTYIRSLVHDFGKELGIGATVVQLRRTKIGEIPVSRSTVLDRLTTEPFSSFLLPDL